MRNMWIPGVQWSALFLACLLCVTDAAILRPYRRHHQLKPYDGNEDQTVINNNRYPVSTSNFKPTQKRCCQIGERVAKKKMVCDITMLALVRKYRNEKRKNSSQYSNRPRKVKRGRRNKLSEKVAKCSVVYPKYFEKCCSYKEEYYKHLKKCQLKPKKQRRRCKQIIKKRLLEHTS